MNATAFAVLLSSLTVSEMQSFQKESAQQEKRAFELVEQLSATSFRIRELAAKELILLGANAKDALQKGSKSSDPHVAERCKKLLPQAYDYYIQRLLDEYLTDPKKPIPVELPGAVRWLKTAGISQDSKDLYTDLIRSYRGLLTEIDQKPSIVSEKYAHFVQEIYSRTRSSVGVQGRNNQVTDSEMLLFLYLASDPNNNRNLAMGGVTSYLPVYTILNQTKLNQLLEAKEGSEPIKRLFVSFIEKETNSNILRRALQLAAQAELKECAPVALKVAKDTGATGLVRAYAITVLAKLGDRKTIEELQPLIEDANLIRNIGLANNVQRTIEIRDVALGVSLLLAKEQMTDFGFERNAVVNVIGVSYSSFTFENEEKRNEALKKWAEYWKNAKKETKK
jgi:hypothetical protein